MLNSALNDLMLLGTPETPQDDAHGPRRAGEDGFANISSSYAQLTDCLNQLGHQIQRATRLHGEFVSRYGSGG